MLDYARMDTHYLFALKDVMEKLLLEKGLMALAREDFDLVSAVTQSEVQPNGKSCWKVAGGSRLSPRETTIYNLFVNIEIDTRKRLIFRTLK